MPPSSLVAAKGIKKDPKRKTKSRNGCGRCKLKRLKCDETSPACMQCKKRNAVCPGYEKTLKWSTKYEVFRPARLSPQLGEFPLTPGLSDTTTVSPASALPLDSLDGCEAPASVIHSAGIQVEPVEGGHGQRDSSEELTIENVSDGARYTLDLDASPYEDMQGPEPYILDDLLGNNGLLPQDLAIDFLDYGDPYGLDDVGMEDFEQDFSVASVDPTFVPSAPSLLLDYYRLPHPSSFSSPADIEAMLIYHYFQDVCVLFSSFDSNLNPFRVAVGKVYQDCPSIYYGIQSMAAAHLANTFPHMSKMGTELQEKAYLCLQHELDLPGHGPTKSSGKNLLSILLLGLTTSWHESRSLGQEHLATARSLILPKLLSSPNRVEDQRETQFFEESLIYWEMLMGFVTQDAMSFRPRRTSGRTSKGSTASRKPDGKIVPHPWTGVAPTVQMLFAEVGKVVHRERILRIYMQENEECAAALEEELLEVEYPLADELADPGDERTSKGDFIVMAEAYRCAGLLEIYRVFPSILSKRLATDRSTWIGKVGFDFPVPRLGTCYEETDKKLWINSLALHILSALESLPSSSGTCCTQPIILLTAASELKLVSSVDYFDIYANDAKVLRARNFVDRRLNEYALRLPAKPILRVIDLVKEVWRRLDAGKDVFWMDVMIDNGWETVMG